jgi:trans-aconitate methyltransferase
MTAFKQAQDWSRYNQTQIDRPEERALARKVLELAGPGAGRQAIDLGGGAGVETAAILRRGWEVLAIDYDPEAAAFASARLTNLERARLTFRTQDFTEIDGLPASDLIHAAWSLPFAGDRLVHLWGVLLEALNPGGWLACELFGDRDSEAQDPDVATLTRQQVDQLLEPLDVVSLETVEQDSTSFTGPHHRHVFTLVARKP